MKGFPLTSFPTGWYQIGWSADLTSQSIQSLQIFNQNVVLYRAEAGQARIVNAACPHLGAHLGAGQVVGDNIQCPFHGWQYDLDGANAVIPFSDRPRPNVRLHQWAIREQNGFILTWYDALGREPMWEWIELPEFDDRDNYYEPEYHPAGVRKILPQQMFENGPDALHFCFVHGSGEPAEITSWKEDFPFLYYEAELKFGADKAPTWLTPNGPAVAHLRSVATIGMGVVYFVLDDIEMSQLVCVTPVDAHHSLLFSSTVGRKDPSGGPPNARAVGMMKYQHAQIERDFSIWETQEYIERPPFSGPEERYFAKFRRFTAAYYPEVEALVGDSAR